MEKWDIWFEYEELWKPLNTHIYDYNAFPYNGEQLSIGQTT